MNVPQNLDLKTPKKINALSRETKKKYYLELLRAILKSNREGLTASQVSRELNAMGSQYAYNSETLNLYMSQLVAMREAYTVPIGNAIVFRYNGTHLHGEHDLVLEKDNRAYHIIQIDNPNLLGEKFFLIQERERNAFNTEKVVGGIMIPQKEMKEFLMALDAISSKLVNYNE